jgi:leader peptidase (prepilin peptidase)/N-methyltransferase
MNTLVAFFAGLLGAAFGSFANVVVYRVPRGMSLRHPPSRCPRCGETLKARDNVPVVSYLLLRGRCRGCRAPVSIRYPLVEAGAAAVWAGAAVRFALEPAAFVALATTVLGIVALIDLDHRRIPRVIVLPALAGASLWVAGLAVARRDPAIVVRSAAAAVGFFVLLYAIAAISGGMGFGDVRLAAFIGVVTGRFGAGVAVAGALLGFIAGGLAATFLLATRRRGRKDAIPFGPALAAGAVGAMFGGSTLVRAWLGL